MGYFLEPGRPNLLAGILFLVAALSFAILSSQLVFQIAPALGAQVVMLSALVAFIGALAFAERFRLAFSTSGTKFSHDIGISSKGCAGRARCTASASAVL